MISLDKKYKTKDGKEVVLFEIKTTNSAGGMVSYPVKGYIRRKGRPPKYMIWSIDGLVDIVWGNNASSDLVEVEHD
jgi:hypothetical protein